MTAPGYSEVCREHVKARGLGQKKAEAAPEPAPEAPKRRGHKPKGMSEALASAREHLPSK